MNLPYQQIFQPPVISPKGDKIACRLKPEGEWHKEFLAMMNADGSGFTIHSWESRAPDFTNAYIKVVEDKDPVWSPDGSRIAFTAWGNDTVLHIYTMKPGGERKLLTPAAMQASSPAWSRNGDRIYFSADSWMWFGGTLCVTGREGGVPTVLSAAHSMHRYPVVVN